MKTARFATLVAKAGKPDHHLTWSEPGKDRALANAAKQKRLLTVHQEMRGGKKDFGIVGLETSRNSQYYIFPRSLKPFERRRVVAIDYELAGEKTTTSLTLPAAKRPKVGTEKVARSSPAEKWEKEPPKPKPPPPPPKRLSRAQIRSRLFTTLDKLEAEEYDAVREHLNELLEGTQE